ncbi:MAG TPA: hypothetical protein VER68_01790 [Azonexus sp.]|nr:hypothetical protein [Azonexus sp.]
MANQANIALVRNVFVATLGDGRRIKHADLSKMAYALFCAGVHASDVRYEWHAGLRMITAGQQVGLSSELLRLERENTPVKLTNVA